MGIRLFVITLILTASVGAQRPDFAPLVKLAKRHDLAFPPADAKLALTHTETWTVLGNSSNSRDPAYYTPGFVLKQNANGSALVLVGGIEKTVSAYSEPSELEFSLEKQERKPGGYLLNASEIKTFICAIQCAERGDLESAKLLWDAYSEPALWNDGSVRRKRIDQAEAKRHLADYLLVFHTAKLDRNGADWGGIHLSLMELTKEFPGLVTLELEKELRNLKATVDAEPAPAGSVEADLVAYSRLPLAEDGEGAAESKDFKMRIVLRGLDAVEELRRLSSDERITTHMRGGMMRIPVTRIRLGALAKELLFEIVGDDVPKEGQTELEFFEARLFDRDRSGQITEVDRVPALIIGKKYPDELRRLCGQFASKAQEDCVPHSLASAIKHSPMPGEDKLALLEDYGKKGAMKPRRAYLQVLAGLDGERCAPLLLEPIRALPKDVDEPYWTCEEANLTHVVMQIEQDDLWRVYLEKAKTCSIGLRMELMNPMNYSYIVGKNHGRRLAFLAAFLEDEEVRKVDQKSKRWEGPHAGFHHDVLSVQNFVAMKIGSILGTPGRPNEFFTPAEWKAFREEVKVALAEVDLPKLEGE